MLPSYQVTKLPSSQVTKLPSYQLISLPSYQVTSLPSYQVTKFKSIISRENDQYKNTFKKRGRCSKTLKNMLCPTVGDLFWGFLYTSQFTLTLCKLYRFVLAKKNHFLLIIFLFIFTYFIWMIKVILQIFLRKIDTTKIVTAQENMLF